MQKRSSKLESTRKLSKTGLVENFCLWSKSTVNGQSQRSTANMCWRGSVTSPRADVAGREAAAGACGAWVRVDWRVWAREARGRYQRCVTTCGGAWRPMERVLVRQKFQPARGGTCDVVSGRSWLGFARDCPFCLSMPVVWQLNAQNVDVRVLQVLWAWRRWLASDSDD